MLGHNLNETLVQLIARAARSGGNLGTKTITANGTYTAHDDNLDGYSTVTVSVPIESATFTQNGTYTAQNGGYSPVIVDVDTYEDEYQALLQCSQQVAAAVGAITGTVPQDCSEILDAVMNDIPAIIDQLEEDVREAEQEAEDAKEEAEECKQCKAQVVTKIQEYNPSFDPQDCQDMVDGVESVSGYEFPSGTVYDPDIIGIVGGDNVTDETLGYTLYSEVGLAWDVMAQQFQNPYLKWGIIDSNGNYTQFSQNAYGGAYPMFQVESYCITNSVTGEWTITYINPFGRRQTSTGTSQDLIGFGDTGHTYKVHKSIPKNV